jgi:arylformamidase
MAGMTPESLWSSDAFERIDLTHKLENGMPVWPDHPSFRQEIHSSFANGDIACNHSLSLSEHSGTHFDAPLHFVPGARSIDAVPLDRFFGRLLTVSASDAKPATELAPDRLLAFEAEHGAIAPGDAVAFHFGWDRFWQNRTDQQGFNYDWPGLSRATAELLVARGVRLVATDAMSVDCYKSETFAAHRTLLAADILIGENFANLGRLPPVSYLVALPLPIAGGSGSPVRAIAFVPRKA